MLHLAHRSCLLVTLLTFALVTRAQLIISNAPTGVALAQRLVGDGVSISNVTLSADLRSVGYFNNRSGTSIGLDSGIVLTNGRAKTNNSQTFPIGLDGNGVSLASVVRADLDLLRGGDADLENILGNNLQTNDATVLEFDFIPLGDSIKFRYVFSSEEYPDFACSEYNDAFAFFIQGPGFPSKTNIALIPGTAQPVTINNINGSNCNPATPFPQYFINNASNTRFTHNGHTIVLTALARVQPCQTYHLKLVIADVEDGLYDSGVFLEAKSLSSNAVQLVNLTKNDPVSGESYLVEGCATGSLNIKRRAPGPFPITINLSYGGTAQNGTDVDLLPSSIIIPANQDSFLLNITPIMDLIPEGIETLKIYTLASCNAGLPTDSTTIQIRDYDILGITPDTSVVCGNSSVQLLASSGYNSYTWDAHPALNNTGIPNPVAAPTGVPTTYVCTATVGSCVAKDSAFVNYKRLELLSKTDVNCKNGTTGQIRIGAGSEWASPLLFSIDGGSFQADSSFNNLPVGPHKVIIRDASNCIDSIVVNLVQAYPDLVQTNTVSAASCSGAADGSIVVNPAGGNPAYLYSIDGTNFVSGNTFSLNVGSYTILIKDANGCSATTGSLAVILNNTLTLDAGPDDTLCEGTSRQLNAVSLATGYTWTPATGLSNAAIKNPVASPVVTTKYYLTAGLGICTRRDSVTLLVNAAPVPNAGPDMTICFGASATLQGTGAAEYNWSPSTYLSSTIIDQPVSQKPKDNISYYLSVKDSKGCASLVLDTIKITVTPAVKLFAGRDTVVAMNQPLQLQVVQMGAATVTSYVWSPDYALSSNLGANPVATLDRDFTYYVTGTTPASCEGSDTINIKAYKGPAIYVPTAFTPDGDGNNELLRAFAPGMKEYHYFKVFNRWGQVLFSTSDFNKGWDGRINGRLQNTGTYVWVAEAVDFRGNLVRAKGTSMIIR